MFTSGLCSGEEAFMVIGPGYETIRTSRVPTEFVISEVFKQFVSVSELLFEKYALL